MKKRAITICVMIIAFFTTVMSGQTQSVETPGNLMKQMQDLIVEAMSKDRLVGVGATLIGEDGKVWKKGYGFADKERHTPFTTQSLLRIGSITKPFTALGVMRLQDKGALHIDEPLVKYLTRFDIKTRAADIRNITIRSLLNHTSGLPNSILLNAWEQSESYTHILDLANKETLSYPPGTLYHYSNTGFGLLGHLIFSVSGQDYPDYIRDHILLPAGMTHSGFPTVHPLNNLSRVYDSDGKSLTPQTTRNIPAGYLFSSIDDMVHFAQELIAIYHGKKGGIVEPQTLREVWSDQSNRVRIPYERMGLGFDLFDNGRVLAIHHGGSDNVSNAVLVIVPERRQAAIALVNTAGGHSLVEAIADTFLAYFDLNGRDHYVSSPATPEESQTTTLTMAESLRHQGLYAHTRGITIKISLIEKELRMTGALGEFNLKPVGPDCFVPISQPRTDQPAQASKGRIRFRDLDGRHLLLWQDAARTVAPLAEKVSLTPLDGVWKNRLGQYEISNYRIPAKESFSRVELLLSDEGLLQLKVFYSSGDYLYNLRIQNDEELVVCGFDVVTGGDTIRFRHGIGEVSMTLYGLTLKKLD